MARNRQTQAGGTAPDGEGKLHLRVDLTAWQARPKFATLREIRTRTGDVPRGAIPAAGEPGPKIATEPPAVNKPNAGTVQKSLDGTEA
jgi:hypothetical protein